MPTQTSKTDLQKYFEKGAYPTQEQFYDWMESYHHKSDKIPIGGVDTLINTLNSKASTADCDALNSKIETLKNQKQEYIRADADAEDYPTVGAVRNYVDARTVKISSDFDHWRKHYIQYVEGRGTVLVLEATYPGSSDMIPVDSGDIVRFYVPWVEKDGLEVAPTYQYHNVVIVLLDKYRNEVYHKWISTSAAERKASALTVKDCYGVCIDVQLGRSSDGYLYPRTMGVVKQDAIVAQATVAPSGTITLENETYTVSILTPDVFGVKALTDNCEIVLPVLDDNKAVTFIIDENGKGLTIGGTYYEAGDTVFCSFDYDDTGAWSVNNTKEPEVPDYSDVSVKWVLDNSFMSYSTKSWTEAAPVYQVHFPLGSLPSSDEPLRKQLVLVKDTIEYSGAQNNADKWRIEKGLYYLYDIAENYKFNIKKIAGAESLSLVTCDNENGYTKKGIWKLVESANGAYFEKLDGKEDVLNKSTDATLSAASDALYPSQKAVKSYVDNALSNISASSGSSGEPAVKVMEATTTDATSVELLDSNGERLKDFSFPFTLQASILTTGDSIGVSAVSLLVGNNLSTIDNPLSDISNYDTVLCNGIYNGENNGVWFEIVNDELRLYAKGQVGKTVNWKLVVHSYATATYTLGTGASEATLLEKRYMFNTLGLTTTAAIQSILTPDTVNPNEYTKNWTPTWTPTKELVIDAAGYIEIEAYINLCPQGGTTTPRQLMVYKTSGGIVSQMDISALMFSSTQSDLTRFTTTSIKSKFPVLAGDTVKVVSHTASNSSVILNSSKVFINIKPL